MENPGRENTVLDHSCSQRSGGCSQLSDLGCILKVESTGFADRLNVGRGVRCRGVVLDASKGFDLSTKGLGRCHLLRCQI